MEVKVLASSQETLMFQRNILFGLCLFAFISNLILAICLIRQEKQVVLIPANLSKEVTITNKYLPTSYLEEMTNFFLSKLLDLTVENLEYQSNIVLRHTHPSNYNNIQEFFKNQKQKYEEYNLNTYFILNSLKINEKDLEVKASGTFVSIFGSTGKTQEKVSYLVKYDFSSGILTIKDFSKIKLSEEEEEDEE